MTFDEWLPMFEKWKATRIELAKEETKKTPKKEYSLLPDWLKPLYWPNNVEQDD